MQLQVSLHKESRGTFKHGGENNMKAKQRRTDFKFYPAGLDHGGRSCEPRDPIHAALETEKGKTN